jgi:site-specific DNA recombinase
MSETIKALRAAAYVRVSTDRQANEGLSLGEQERRVTAHAEGQGWTLGEVFADAGESGRRDDRPALVALLSRLDEFDVVIVPKLDRLGRSASHLWSVYGQFERENVALVSLSEGFDTSTVAGRLLRAVLSAVAELESDTIGERVRSVMGARARAGRAHGGPTSYGYGRAAGQLVEDEAEAAVVRWVFERFVAGESQRAIQRSLNRRAVPTRKGGPWHQGNIAKMLRSPHYVGRVRLHGETFEGLHDGIVSAELWESAQRLLRPSTAGGRGRRTAGKHLFAKGMLRCGGCGASMVPRTIKSGVGRRSSYETYICYRRMADREACSREPIKRAVLDDAVLRYFENVAVDLEGTRELVLERLAVRRRDTVEELRRARRDYAEKVEQRARIDRDYLAGDLSARSYDDLRDSLESEKTAAAAEVQRLAERLESFDTGEVEAELDSGGLADLAAIREAVAVQVRTSAGLEEVRSALRRLFESFVVRRVVEDDAGRVEEDLEFGRHFEGLGCEWWLEPRVRADAVDGFERLVKWDPEHGAAWDGMSTDVVPRLRRLAIALDIDNDGFVT